MVSSIDINCDMGEGMGNDALLMPFISSANIACGYHAGDEDTMKHTCALALSHGVSIGAHPGFADRENFGRTEMHLSHCEIFDLVTEQVYRLREIAEATGTRLRHVKPHGALYNMSARDASIARTIAAAVKEIDPSLVLFGLSGTCSIAEAKELGLNTASEVFADRSYADDGSLTPRSHPDALISSEGAAVQQVLQMIRKGTVTSTGNLEIPIEADTICLHGDGAHALAFARHIHQTLQQYGIGIGKK